MKAINKLISLSLPFVPTAIVRYFANPYIAGERLDDAVHMVRDLMSEGACATLDVLGEEVSHEEQTQYAVELYKQALHRIQQEKLDCNISLKPTHMGLGIDPELCYRNIRAIVETAKIYNTFVRIDMEDHTTTSNTLEIFTRLRREFDNVGVVLQAYLRRTISDVNKLIPLNPNLRICKGIYVEPHSIAYKDRDIVNKNFAYLLDKLLVNNCYVGIATHDERVIWEALRLIDRYNISRDKYEFQMLLGVEPHLRKVLLQGGHRLRIYVPFGSEWKAYSTRRLKENPDIAAHITRNLVRRMLGGW